MNGVTFYPDVAGYDNPSSINLQHVQGQYQYLYS